MSKRVIIYDDEDLSLEDFGISNIDYHSNPNPSVIENTLIGDIKRKYIDGMIDCQIILSLSNSTKKIELDPTTMKKIAKYNKEEDIKELDIKSKKIKNDIKTLNKKVDKLEKMIPELKDLTKDYIDKDYTDFNEYLSDKYEKDYYYDDWDF